jgi:ATP-dependent exoDNAse (exonuclease V) alpha subunit
MAIYHLSIKIFSRGSGASAIAKAAYRAAECIASDYDGQTYDYKRKRGVIHKEIILPENAPQEYSDRAILWNAVEKSERYRTAQLAREIEIALPVELSTEQNISLVRRYVKENFVNAGMCADICVHDNNDGNPHAHIMLTMRPIEKDGRWGQKSKTIYGKKVPTTDWNDRDRVEDWRKAWAAYCNVSLRANGNDAIVDHRSYERQGVDIIPTIHIGSAASRMERRNIHTDVGNKNREINLTNRELRMIRARLNKLESWLKEEILNDEQPTLSDVISDILKRQGQSSISRLKTASQMLVFLHNNQINDIAGLEEKVKSMYSRNARLRDRLKPIERRIKTLDEHIKQAEIYRKLKSKVRTESEEILFAAADRYLKGALNGHKLNIKVWKKERESLATEKDVLYQEYTLLKKETREIETIKRSIENILHDNHAKPQPKRIHER